MSRFKVGQALTSWQDFLDLPTGTEFEFQEDLGYDSKSEFFYRKTDTAWQIINKSNQHLDDEYDLADGRNYFAFDGSNVITKLPDETLLGVGTPVNDNAEPDEATVVKEEFVPKYPNDPDNPNKETPRGDVLREAEHLITGDRNITYGSPTQNFRNIAEIWTTLLRHKLKPGERVTATNVADLMVGVKLARNVAQPKRDNFVDGAGYFACGYEAYLDEI